MSPISTSGNDTQQSRVYRTSLRRTAFILMGCVGMLTMMVWASGLPTISEPKRLLATYVGIPLCVFAAVAIFLKLILRTPALVIDGFGLTLPGFLMGSYRLKWEEIVGFREFSVKNQQFLGIQLANPAETLVHMGFGLRLAARINSAFCGYPFSITLGIMPVPLDALMDDINQYSQNRFAKQI